VFYFSMDFMSHIDTNADRLVKLLQNFRSHPRLLQFPSRTFYGGELQPHANPVIVNMFEQWEHHPSPTRKFPIIFHSISGNDEQEASSPSYFNRFEASQVKVYVEQLLAGGLVGMFAFCALKRLEPNSCAYLFSLRRHWSDNALSCSSQEDTTASQAKCP
jgi:hypothetical protein